MVLSTKANHAKHPFSSTVTDNLCFYLLVWPLSEVNQEKMLAMWNTIFREKKKLKQVKSNGKATAVNFFLWGQIAGNQFLAF